MARSLLPLAPVLPCRCRAVIIRRPQVLLLSVAVMLLPATAEMHSLCLGLATKGLAAIFVSHRLPPLVDLVTCLLRPALRKRAQRATFTFRPALQTAQQALCLSLLAPLLRWKVQPSTWGLMLHLALVLPLTEQLAETWRFRLARPPAGLVAALSCPVARGLLAAMSPC